MIQQKLNLKTFPLKEELKKFKHRDLTYWKASGKIGHWNQFVHVIVGKYLVKELHTLLETTFKKPKTD